MKRPVRRSLRDRWEAISHPEHVSRKIPISKVSQAAREARECYENGEDHLEKVRSFLLTLVDYISTQTRLDAQRIEEIQETQLLLLKLSSSLGDLSRGAKSDFLPELKRSGRPPANSDSLDFTLAIVRAYRRVDRLWSHHEMTVRERQELIASMVRKKGAADFSWRDVRSAVSNLERVFEGYDDPEYHLEIEVLLDEETDEATVEQHLSDDVSEIASLSAKKKSKP